MLNYLDLYNGFIEVMDNTNEYSEDFFYVGQKWTDVFKRFYMNQIMPIPGVTNPNLFPSLQAFKLNFISAMKSQIVKTQFEVLVQTLHLGVCMGVNMIGIYTTTPPVVPLRLQHCFDSNLSTKIIANLLATTIFSWVQTTFSVQTSSGAVIKWM